MKFVVKPPSSTTMSFGRPVQSEPVPAAADEPPPWMDEAPFEGEAAALVSARAPAVHAATPTPTPTPTPPATAVIPQAATAVAPSTPVPEVRRTALGDRWADLVAALVAANAIAALARELAMQAELTLVEPADGGAERWCLRVERETLRAPTLAEKLQAALRAHTGLSIRIEVAAGTPGDSPARREAEAAAQRQREAEAIIHDDPLVQAMLAQFSTARIVPGSIRPA